MTNRHPVLLVLRMFGTVFIIVFLISMFWNTLSWMAGAGTMFPMAVAFWVAVVYLLELPLQLRCRRRQHGLPPAFSKWLTPHMSCHATTR